MNDIRRKKTFKIIWIILVGMIVLSMLAFTVAPMF